MLNALSGRKAKESGMQAALDFSGDGWKERVLAELEAWIAVQRAQGRTEMVLEEFRAVAKNHPHSSAAWGSVPGLAMKAGLIAPLARDDGSQVMRPAAAVKTHGHFVRVWKLLGARTATSHDTDALQAQRQSEERESGGAVLHTGSGSMSAIQAYNRERAAMGGQG